MALSAIGVRRATPHDLPGMTRLWAEYMEVHRACDPGYGLVRGAQAHWSRWVRSRLGSSRSLVLVAEKEGRLVGFCHAQIMERPPVMKERHYGTILDFAVTGDSRRSGIGTLLFRACAKWFKARGLMRIELRVLLSNPLAVSFWKAMGFRPHVQILCRSL